MTLQAVPVSGAPTDVPVAKLDLIDRFVNAPWPVKLTILVLVGCSLMVWMIAVLKLLQLARLRLLEGEFERRTRGVGTAAELYELVGASRGMAPGARILGELYARGSGAQIERLRAMADRAILSEGQAARRASCGCSRSWLRRRRSSVSSGPCTAS